MPLFGGKARPKLDGLTKEEEKLRDGLNPEVLKRAGEKGVAGQMPAAAAILREKREAEPRTWLWPHLLGWQALSMRRFDNSIESFQEAIKRDPEEIRSYYGAGHAFFEAAEAKLNSAGNPQAEELMGGMTVDNLYHEAMRNFKRALEMTTEKDERDRLSSAVSVVDKALAKKAGRM